MTQIPPPARSLYRTWGKDRLSDPWVTFECRFRWQAIEWADQRAFALLDLQQEPQVAVVAPEGRSRIEWVTTGGWQPYTAWEPAERRTAQIEWIEREKRSGSRQTYRVVIEDESRTIVGI